MACLYKRRTQYWVSYYLNGRQVKKSLHTDDPRIGRDKIRKIEYELSLGDLPQASRLPLPALLEEFCGHLKTRQTYRSYRKDVSRLRNVFGEPPLGWLPGRDDPCRGGTSTLWNNAPFHGAGEP